MNVIIDKIINYKDFTLEHNSDCYYVIIVNTDKTKRLFYEYLNHLINNKYEKSYIALDFEFNTKIVALFQLCFEISNFKKLVFFIYPPNLSKDTNYSVKHILKDKHYLKIIHGSDSLDFPYLFNNYFDDKSDIKSFMENTIDTKYMCEYYNIKHNVNEKCKIYHLLKNHGVIDSKMFDKIDNNDEKMGKIYDIKIDINNLSDELKRYSAYDVIFLRKLADKMMKQKFYELVKQVTAFVILSKNGLFSFFEIIKFIAFRMNLNSIDNKKFDDLYKENISHDILKVNYFKKNIEVLLKYNYYFNLVQNNKDKNIVKGDGTKYDGSKLKKLYLNESKFNEIVKILG